MAQALPADRTLIAPDRAKPQGQAAQLRASPNAPAAFQPPNHWGFSQSSLTFQATKVVDSDRYRDLERRESYAECKQHDHKRYDFDGRSITPGAYTTQPLMGSQAAPYYVPLAQRRPCAPLRLGKSIVNAFTKLTFGEDRWPDMLCKEDEKTQDFVAALCEATELPVKMIMLRKCTGSCGAGGISWYVSEGEPRVEVHRAKTIHVHEWSDAAQWIPRHVTKVYRYDKSVWDPERRAIVVKRFWYRRDWTPVADVFYEDAEVREGQEPAWVMDEVRSVRHGSGKCHFVWVQNVESQDQDSEPDYHGLYEKMDEVDTINSVVTKGAKLNLDPTLVLGMEPEMVGGALVMKGSEHALITGPGGSANYLELMGTSLAAGDKLVERLKSEVLDEAECVVPDPDKVAAGSVSSVALQMVYAPMLGKRGLICSQFGKAIKRLLVQMLDEVREHWNEKVEVVTEAEDGSTTSESREVVNYVQLPPRAVEEPVLGEDGQPTGEVNITFEEREPGTGTLIELQWGPAFKPNSIDVQNTVTTMSTAVGGKAVLSRKAAVEVISNMLGKDPMKVLKELEDDDRQAMAMQGSMFGLPGAGDTLAEGEAGKPAQALDPKAELEKGTQVEMEEHELDEEQARKIAQDHLGEDPAYYFKQEGAAVARPGTSGKLGAQPTGSEGPPELALTSSDLGAIVTVNEARACYGLGPWPDEDGKLTLVEFKAKHGSVVAAAAGADKGQDPNKPKPPPPQFGGGAPPFGKKSSPAPLQVGGKKEPVEEPVVGQPPEET